MAAVAFLFVLTVHFSWELSRLEERTRTLAEEVALLRDELARRNGSPPPASTDDSRRHRRFDRHDEPDVPTGAMSTRLT